MITMSVSETIKSIFELLCLIVNLFILTTSTIVLIAAFTVYVYITITPDPIGMSLGLAGGITIVSIAYSYWRKHND